jgi:hypothetical protein
MNVSINKVTGDEIHRQLNSHTGIATEPRGDKKCEVWKRSKTVMLFVTNSVQLDLLWYSIIYYIEVQTKGTS